MSAACASQKPKKPEQLTSYCTAEFGKSMTGNVSMYAKILIVFGTVHDCAVFFLADLARFLFALLL